MMARFNLPDLGEGLQEAEIIRWHVAVGDTVQADQPMVALETAKAVVEVPAPWSGEISALHGKPGDTVATGAALVDFKLPGEAAAGGVVGRMPTDAAEVSFGSDKRATDTRSAERAETNRRARAMPAARDLARKLGVDIEALNGSGRDGLVTVDDVLAAAPARAAATPTPKVAASALRPSTVAHEDGELEVLRSLRRAMAQSMANARDNVMECTVCDMADIERWNKGSDYTVRLLRAISCGARAEPGLNAWFDTADGLIVPVIRDVGNRSPLELRAELERLKTGARERTLPAADLRDFTFMLSNFGVMAGRYATPVVVPPAVAILGAGTVSRDVVAVDDRIEAHSRMPLSLTFDHRCVTGGEAVRLLAAVIADLELPH
jgi:2-oxoisovalerate dehydrogenase E2 component (dihydrolipoyl transacylase)